MVPRLEQFALERLGMAVHKVSNLLMMIPLAIDCAMDGCVVFFVALPWFAFWEKFGKNREIRCHALFPLSWTEGHHAW